MESDDGMVGWWMDEEGDAAESEPQEGAGSEGGVGGGGGIGVGGTSVQRSAVGRSPRNMLTRAMPSMPR